MDKIVLINQTAEVVSKILEIPPCKLSYLKMPDIHHNVIALFINDHYQINFNMDIINDCSDIEICASIVHELRHAYQWCQINKLMEIKEIASLIDRWKYEFANYIHPNQDQLNFLNQSIEIDAISYTRILCEKLFNQKLIIPEAIESKISSRIKEIISNKIQ